MHYVRLNDTPRRPVAHASARNVESHGEGFLRVPPIIKTHLITYPTTGRLRSRRGCQTRGNLRVAGTAARRARQRHHVAPRRA